MENYLRIGILGLIIFPGIVQAIFKIFRKDEEINIPVTLIVSGATITVGAFPAIPEFVLAIIGKSEGLDISTKADYLVFFCGLAMVLIGIGCYRSVRDRIFVLNMFGLSVKKEISDLDNSNFAHEMCS